MTDITLIVAKYSSDTSSATPTNPTVLCSWEDLLFRTTPLGAVMAAVLADRIAQHVAYSI